MIDYGDDIYTEPDASVDTLANLGPLRALAGVWEGPNGADEHPAAARDTSATCSSSTTTHSPSIRRPTGRSCFYGLRYHTHIVKPGEVETFHDQVGFWLWEPAARTVTMTLAHSARPGVARIRSGGA